MAMKGIPSREIVTVPEMIPGIAPRHTDPDHRLCAYYLKETFFQHGESIDMMCPHNKTAGGAFYNEDFVRRFRELSHRLIAIHDHGGDDMAMFAIYIEELRELTK